MGRNAAALCVQNADAASLCPVLPQLNDVIVFSQVLLWEFVGFWVFFSAAFGCGSCLNPSKTLSVPHHSAMLLGHDGGDGGGGGGGLMRTSQEFPVKNDAALPLARKRVSVPAQFVLDSRARVH